MTAAQLHRLRILRLLLFLAGLAAAGSVAIRGGLPIA